MPRVNIRTRYRNSIKNTIRNKLKCKTKNNKNQNKQNKLKGGASTDIKIIYNDISHDNIASSKKYDIDELENENATEWKQSGYLEKEPNIELNGIDLNKTYLITMVDPDAPNGMESNTSNGNKDWTHWIFTQTGNNLNTRKVILPYSPPNPPRGTHRYIFKVYDASTINIPRTGILEHSNNSLTENLKNKTPIVKKQYKVQAI